MKIRWHWVLIHAVLIAGTITLAAAVLFNAGLVNRWLRDLAIHQIEQRTGATVEMGAFRFQLWRLEVEIDNLTLHGREAPGALPLFHADRTRASVRVLSAFRRQFALEELNVLHPVVGIQIDRNGRSNVPSPKVQGSSRPWQQTLFALRIGQLALVDGTVQFNDQAIPLSLQGKNFEFALHYGLEPDGTDAYAGSLAWQQVQMAAKRYVPFRFDLSTKFTLHRDAFELDELICKLPHSEFDVTAALPSFARPDWNMKYRGRLSLTDVRTILHAPETPDGIADFSGQASSTGGKWVGGGYYHAHDIRLPYEWFHWGGIETAGDYKISDGRLTVPNLKIKALAGFADGTLELKFAGLQFRTETHMEGADLHDVLEALDHEEFPVNALHWDASMRVDSVNTWTANFKHFRTVGTSEWTSPAGDSAGLVGVAAHVNFDYQADEHGANLVQSEISSPRMRLEFDGPISGQDSALEVKFHTDELLEWDDFINAIRGRDADRVRIAGGATWRGRVLGPIDGPTFIGHVITANSKYEQYSWDSLEGEIEYSPDDFHLTHGEMRHGASSTSLDLSLTFDRDWGFLPESPWSLNAKVGRASTDDVQEILGTNFAASGVISGELVGSGTRAAPMLDANLSATDVRAGQWHADRFGGELHLEHDLISLTHAEIHESGSAVTGNALYRTAEQRTEFNLTGTNIALEKIKTLQGGGLAVVGRLDFNFHGGGPLMAPTGQGTVHVAGLKVGTENEGDFEGRVDSDGDTAHISLASEQPRGEFQGDLTVGLRGDRNVSGRLLVHQFDLDPFIVAAVHLPQLTGHSSVDGTFTISGALRRPDSVAVDADITRMAFDYNYVQLSNDQDIKLTYRRNEIRVDQARLHGPDTDLQFSGTARFDQQRPVHLQLAGAVDLRLLKSILPDMEAKGRAEMNVSVEGTIDHPRVTGRASVQNASAHYGDFPTGLSNVNGGFVFDKSRLLFDHVTAESGGGQLTLDGNVAYGEGPVRYQVRATTSQVRIRYPAGMSWLAGGTIELSGTSDAAVIGGHVQVQRLLFAQGVDMASMFAAASDTAPGAPSSSLFLQNLSFDVAGDAGPGARIEWAGAHIEVDGNVRLRGTYDRPVLLGHVHLLSGEMPFRGNTYQLTRGDINFADPFRLDPDLNIEATSTINQYQVTINFSGRASRLQLNYRSDPPLPDADIIALLALGSPGQESGLRSGPGGSANYGATALLSEAISSGIGGRIEHLFGISSFRVDPFVAETATESNAAARVTIQQQVTRDLSITYSTNAAANQQYQLIQVAYALRRDLSVIFLRDVNGTNGLDIKWVKHFK